MGREGSASQYLEGGLTRASVIFDDGSNHGLDCSQSKFSKKRIASRLRQVHSSVTDAILFLQFCWCQKVE